MTTFPFVRRMAIVSASFAFFLTACSAIENDGSAVRDVARTHKINVTSQFVTTPIEVSADAQPLSLAEAAKLATIVDDFVRVGGDSLELSVPMGSSGSEQAKSRAAVVRNHALKLGAQPSEVQVLFTKVAGNGPVVVSYERYTATPPHCGPTVDNMAYNPENVTQDTYGCVTQHNFATMISNPADLVKMQAESPQDAARRTDGLREWRAGDDPSSSVGARSGPANSF